MTEAPLLSICIPTYNRGYILREIFEKYAHNKEIDDDVEIVVSDNCSSDDTENVCKEYSEIIKNLRYYKNSVNIHDANFYTVLNYGRGIYLKLTNDWSYLTEDSLKFVKESIRENMYSSIPLFFSNNSVFTKKKADIINCKNLDEYVQAVSTYVTSNNIFGAWRQQWIAIKERDKYTELKLQQVDWTYQLVSNYGGCVIYNKKILETSEVKRKILTGYNWFKIHIDNYYQIMEPYIEKGDVSSRTLLKDKHNLLEHFKKEFCFVYLYNYSKVWKYETKGTTDILIKYYNKDPYIIYYFMKLPFCYVNILITGLRKKLKKSKA